MNLKLKILLYGYGNPGRQDDGLGNEFITAIEKWIKNEKIYNIATDSNYQLNIEDSYTISQYDIIIFIDASEEPINDFCITTIETTKVHFEFTNHSVSPQAVLTLCKHLYHKTPDAYLLHIKGYEWEFVEGITQQAQQNLNKALAFIKRYLKNPSALSSQVIAPFGNHINN